MSLFTRNNGPVYAAVDDSSSGGMDLGAIESSYNTQQSNDAMGEKFDNEMTAEQDAASLEKDADSKQTQF